MGNTIKARITATIVKNLELGMTVWDLEVKGFGVRRQSASRTYFLKTRIRNRQRWFTIGKHGSPWTPERARKHAHKILHSIYSGEDPALDRDESRNALTVGQLSDRFLAEHGPRLKSSTYGEYESLVRRFIKPNFGSHGLMDVTRSQVSRLHTKLIATPYRANFVLRVLSKMMNWAEDHDLKPINTNPCRGIKKYPDVKRERFLTLDEFNRLGSVLDQAEQDGSEGVFALAALRLLIFTGARKGEILTLKWGYVDYDRSVLNLPDSKTGKKIIHLNDPALAILGDLPRIAGNPYVLPGHRDGQHLINLTKPWFRLRKKAGLEDVRIHDLRHSFASVIASSGGSLPMIGALLGHTQTQTTARYAHLFDDPVRKLNQDAGMFISNAMSNLNRSGANTTDGEQ